MNVTLVDRADAIASVASRLSASEVIPLDVESNGLHAYRPILCTMQVAVVHGGGVREIIVIDTIAVGDAGLASLRPVLGADGPRKILHDLAFDARILAAHGVTLGNVIDTSITARFLGLTSTGLSTLVEQKLGTKLSKDHQHHDWALRPLTPELLQYLRNDVAYLPELARVLASEAEARDLLPEIDAETQYRIDTALESIEVDDPRPPYVRIKGTASLEPLALSVLRRVAEIREEASRSWNLPPFKVLGNEVLIDLARKRPADPADLRHIRGRASSLLGPLRQAIADGVRDGDIPAEERERFFAEPVRTPRAELDARKGREQRLGAWRKKTARERSVDDQVVLPGHCLQEIVDRQPADLAALAQIRGIGARRLLRDGAAIVEALHFVGADG